MPLGETREKQIHYFPKLFCKQDLSCLGSLSVPESRTILTESLQANRFWTALCACPMRDSNAQILQQFYQDVISRLSSKRGKKSDHEKAAISVWQDKLDKLRDREDEAAALMEHLQKHDPSRPAKRHRKKVSSPSKATGSSVPAPSQEDANTLGNPFNSMPVVTLQVTYDQKLDDLIRTRRYANGFSCQKLARVWQTHVAADTVDLDITNCCFVLLLQMLDKLQPQHSHWAGVRETLRECAEDRELAIRHKLKTVPETGKLLLIKIFNGGLPPEEFSRNEFVLKVQKASTFCRWLAASLLPEVFQHASANRPHPDSSCLFYLWSAVEDMLLDPWLEHLLTLQPSHTSLHFDGVRVSRSVTGPDLTEFCRGCNAAIEKQTGFRVDIRAKTHKHFMQILLDTGAVLDHSVDVPDENHRTYGQLQEALQISIEPIEISSNLSSVSLCGKYLLHCISDDRPHCIALVADGTDLWKVSDGKKRISVEREQVLTAWTTSVDRLYLVLFQVGGPKIEEVPLQPNFKQRRRLLELQAAAGSEPSRARPIVCCGSETDSELFAEEDESMCRAGDRILELLRQEVEAVLAKRIKPVPIEDSAMLVCPLCPFRGFGSSNPNRLYKHVRNYHDGPRQFCPSGTKQMKLLISIYDNDRLLGREERPDLLQRSATLIRQTVLPALERSINQIDRYIRLVLTGSGPEYWNLTAVLQAPLRRARNIYYNVDFAQMLFQQTLVQNAKVHAIMAALHTRVHGDAASLLPSHAKDWWPVLEDIFTSSAVVDMEANLVREAIGHKECLCLSIDATLRCCLSVLGQPKRRRSSREPVQAAFDEESMLRRAPLIPSVNSFIQAKVFTVRGRTNATLIMTACQSDDARSCAEVLSEGLPAEGLRQVQYVSVDNPSRHYLLTLKTICPNLQLMALDPVHLAMTCEYASSRRRTGFTRVLRRLLCKFTAVDSTLDAGAWGKFFDGRNSPPLTAAEIKFRNQIEDRSMRQTEAVRLLEGLDPTTPFYSRTEWVQMLAAVVSVHRQEADRLAPGPNRRIWQLLHTASAADRSEWYLNNIRLRHSFPRTYLNLLPAGTTSNESLHHEINSWFRETQKIHQSSLKMKLRILRLGKLISHNAAMYHQTSRQLSQAIVLARASSHCLWNAGQWKEWCSLLEDDGKLQKAELPVEKARSSERAAVRVRAKHGTGSRLPKARVRRRTPHTLKRKDGLRRGGVHVEVMCSG
ncbi:unnamed protein product [Symbiodinium microadriaticum]|nr:unnamed protein product [Symbiodinium microadriaticum]